MRGAMSKGRGGIFMLKGSISAGRLMKSDRGMRSRMKTMRRRRRRMVLAVRPVDLAAKVL